MCSKCDARKAPWVPKVGDKGKTRVGQDYEIVYVNEKLPRHQQVTAVIAGGDVSGTDMIRVFSLNGHWSGSAMEHNHDLMPPVVVTPGPDEVFVSIYEDESLSAWPTSFDAHRYCVGAKHRAVRYVKAD